MPDSVHEIKTSNSEEATLNNRGYKLLKKLGEGSYAKVYLGEFKTDDADKKYQLACKIVDTSKAPKDFVKKFLPRELEILVKLNHPHVVHVHSIFQRRAKYYIFMRYAENGDLLDFVLKNGSVAENQARVWLRQISLALQYLHELEIAHRDLKCENILITSNFNAKLADFGFARYVVDPKTRKAVLSETYCGSLSYAAPEILKGAPYNPKNSDVWSLGVVLYIMLNKAMPFDDTNIKKLYEQQTNRRWKFRARVVDSLTEQVKNQISNMLEPDITKRWRVNQVVLSDWIKMDTRLVELNPPENAALNQAIAERRKLAQDAENKIRSSMSKSPSFLSKKKDDDNVNVLKEVANVKTQPSQKIPSLSNIQDPVGVSSLLFQPKRQMVTSDFMLIWSRQSEQTARHEVELEQEVVLLVDEPVVEDEKILQTGFGCLHCGVYFLDETLYFLHKGCHSVDNAWRCNICGEQLHNMYEFNSHLLRSPHD